MIQVDLIIWDEAPMTNRLAYEALDRTLKDIIGYQRREKVDQPFGGKTVLLAGDFRQILPIISRGQRHDIVHSCINKSNLWDYWKIFMLSTNMRVRDTTLSGEQHMLTCEFNRWLLQLGDGKVEAKCRDGEDVASWTKIPPQYLIQPTNDPLKQTVDNTYP
jgi:ATP-dependent DNA helicase PIF1